MITRVSHKVKTKKYRTDNMLTRLILKPYKWLAAFLSCLSMTMSPVALGQEAEKLNKKQIQNIVSELGLDKKITLGEFWEKSKSFVSPHIYKDLEAFARENKNRMMPEVSLMNSQSTEGLDVPVIRFMQNGQTQLIQFHGTKDKWAKFNSVVLSENDLSRVDDVFKRIEASDIQFKREADLYREKKLQTQKKSLEVLQVNEFKKDFSRFSGFPRVTPQMWKSLTIEQRAGFIIKMRLLALNARKVLAFYPPQSGKTSAAIENFYNLFNSKAFALDGKATPSAAVNVKGTSVRTSKGVVNIPYTAKTCVVAGYIGAYGTVSNINGKNRSGCSVDLAIATYKSNSNLKFVQEANEACAAVAPSFIACNPIIYGYPSGKEACIDRKSAEYQHATHFKSPANKDTCDGKSKLASSDGIIQFNDKDYSNIQPREKQIAAIEADQKKDDFALTQAYIQGILNKRDPILLAMLEKGEWNLALDDELVRIQSQFEEEIERAIKTCEADISGKHEKNQKLACDQLHRRWLFTERSIASLRDKACVKPALYAGNYNDDESSYADTAKEKTTLNKKTIDVKGTELCECPGLPKRVNFATKCDIPSEEPKPEIVPEPEAAPVATQCEKPVGIAGFDYDKCKCENNKKLKASVDGTTYDCEGTNWLPWVIGGLTVAALIAIFSKSKQSPETPPVAPKHVPPAPLCAAPKIGSPPNCECPAAPSFCTLPQKIYNMLTCQCTNVVEQAICPNNSEAPMGNLAQCPKCADGSFKTTRPCPSEGGSGTNPCLNPPCSGGLPGTGQ